MKQSGSRMTAITRHPNGTASFHIRAAADGGTWECVSEIPHPIAEVVGSIEKYLVVMRRMDGGTGEDPIAVAAYALASYAASSELKNTPEFIEGIRERIDEIDRLLVHQCEKCDWQSPDGWMSKSCGASPLGSCTGKLLVVRRPAKAERGL